MNSVKIENAISDSLKQNDFVLLNVRSPGEFTTGHIPGAQNLPLLDNDQRHQVGICYKESGQSAAVELGFRLTGHLFHDYIRQAREMAAKRKIILYCWRGGMRSNIMSWLLTQAGLNVSLIEGGYKSYRKLALKLFESPLPFLVISGSTGVGKTEIMHQLERCGENILDLEYYASHKGSAFGALGQNPQPTQEQFENKLAFKLFLLEGKKEIWVEHESRSIGRIRVPDGIFNTMQKSPVIIIERSSGERCERVLREYGSFPKDELMSRTLMLGKRMGYDNVQFAAEALENGDMHKWVELLLEYYDKSYKHSFEKNKIDRILSFDCGNDDTKTIAEKLISLKSQLMKI